MKGAGSSHASPRSRLIEPALDAALLGHASAAKSDAATRLLPSTAKPDAHFFAQRAKIIFKARRDRDTLFADIGVHFGEPGWDIMLDLYQAHYEKNQVSVSSACIAASVPATTGLRHLVLLEDRGLVQRDYDAHDRRRSLVTLTALGLAMMELWILRVGGASICPCHNCV